MRLVVQRVSSASVSVNEEVVSKIGRGLCVLVGLQDTDTHDDLVWMANKLLKFRLFDDDPGRRWARGVQEAGLELLCVSQFTLCCELKGNKPDYRKAMAGETASAFYTQFLEMLRREYEAEKIKDGVFGAMMQVGIINDGPVTVTLDHPPLPHEKSKQGDVSSSSKKS
ncbi:D-aminoacyl-tRNA deacylase [Hyalella azteca]|uniref:D-aminoacyl-tRNA deacylase n=1 Tax=Hyalella azteca TaxID=294128 RepID=A0A8B7NV89_HYAAZ|nr:D-aminoacyl-tRNA deacylase [Hyalella azteca]